MPAHRKTFLGPGIEQSSSIKAMMAQLTCLRLELDFPQKEDHEFESKEGGERLVDVPIAASNLRDLSLVLPMDFVEDKDILRPFWSSQKSFLQKLETSNARLTEGLFMAFLLHPAPKLNKVSLDRVLLQDENDRSSEHGWGQLLRDLTTHGEYRLRYVEADEIHQDQGYGSFSRPRLGSYGSQHGAQEFDIEERELVFRRLTRIHYKSPLDYVISLRMFR
ncbi:MAG: hypothetical protein Q9218_006710 [Villophora microphyllina]